MEKMIRGYRDRVDRLRGQLNLAKALTVGIVLFLAAVTAIFVSSISWEAVQQWAQDSAREGMEELALYTVSAAMYAAPVAVGALAFFLLNGFLVDALRDNLKAAENSYLYASALIGAMDDQPHD